MKNKKKNKKKAPLKIRVMAEYGSSGIWGFSDSPSGLFRHGMVSHGDLFLPSELRKEFEQWIEIYDLERLHDNFDTAGFNRMGLSLSEKLKQFLGADSHVEYQGETDEGSLLKPVIIE